MRTPVKEDQFEISDKGINRLDTSSLGDCPPAVMLDVSGA
jgi:hypothetical protein